MGVNNRQRRAAKKKQKVGHRPRPSGSRESPPPEPTPELARAVLLDVLADIATNPSAAEPRAQELLRSDGPLPPDLTRWALTSLLGELTAGAVAHGWTPSDLVHVVRREVADAPVPTMLGLLGDEVRRHRADRVSARWLGDLADAGPGVPLDLRSVGAVRAALLLASCLAGLPPIPVLMPPPGRAGRKDVSRTPGETRLLAKVRALLAKAEATEYDEEAEALSAKAQELISRHALERLLDSTDPGPAQAGSSVSSRRIWIDPPYVSAKALLVAAVADANRCRSVISEGIGFCTVLGEESDLAPIDVLVTSLLLQAGTALRRHGRQLDRTGTSRTRSFRQSFLVAYASRIRERLQTVSDQAVETTGRAGDLLPALHRQAERLDAATEAMFPEMTRRAASVGNARGWVAGRAAADAAQLQTAARLAQAAG